MVNSGSDLIDRNFRSTLIDDLTNDDAVWTVDQIVREHATELTIRRRQLTTVSRDGLLDDARWLKEMSLFIEQIVDPQTSRKRNSVQSARRLRLMIDEATASYASSRVCFSIDATPLAFEHRVADALEDLGWEAGLVNGEGDRGIDVFAEMRDKRVVVECIYAGSALGRSTVQNAYDRNSLEDSDYVAIVSNAEFAPGARRCAASTRVILLHHHELMRLEERIFGTDSWRRMAPRLPPAAGSDSTVPAMPKSGPTDVDAAQTVCPALL